MSRMQSHWGADALSKELPDQSKARGHDGNVYTQLELHDEISQTFGREYLIQSAVLVPASSES